MPISFLFSQRDLEQGNGHFLVLVQRKRWYSISEDSPQGEWDRTAEKMMLEFAESADIQSSVPRVHCPEVDSKAKAVENCRYTIVPTRTRLQLFFAQLLLYISSVLTEQSQKCVKNMKPFMIERENPLWEAVEFLIRAKRDQDRRAFG